VTATNAPAADAPAAAVVLEPAGSRDNGPAEGLTVIDIAAHTVADAASLMTWSITDNGFRMTLDRQVPDVLARYVGPAPRPVGEIPFAAEILRH